MSPTLRRWIPVTLWVTVIYTTIGFVRVLREWFVERWDPVLIAWSVAGILIVAAGTTVIVLRRRALVIRPGAMLWLAGVTLVLVLWTFSLRRSPEEAVHFLEYGLLAILLHRALRPTMPDAFVFIAGALAGAFIGTMDEVIQWFSPSRFWDWRDIVLNTGAGAFIQFTLWRVLPLPSGETPSRSKRIILRLMVGQLLLLTICLANTPQRVARYGPGLPGFEHLTSPENPMAEYGHLHRVTGLGSFKSRIDLSELDRQDRDRASEVAALVDEARHKYGVFLKTWPAVEDPFTYEMRVHLFSRDRNIAKARKRGFIGGTACDQLTTSWHENRILENFFGRSLSQSTYTWPPKLRRQLESLRDPDFSFRSAAGSHLICFSSEMTLRLILLALVTVCVITDIRLRSSDRRRS